MYAPRAKVLATLVAVGACALVAFVPQAVAVSNPQSAAPTSGRTLRITLKPGQARLVWLQGQAPNLAALSPLPPAPANTVWFHLVTNRGMRNVARVERALIDQETQVAAAWGTPAIRFGSTGIPVYVESEAQMEIHCLNNEAAGCHWLAPEEAIFVENFAENVTLGNLNQDSMTSALSHEIIEAMVDPDGSRPEVCDPVAWQEYKIDGVVVSAWETPAHYR